MKGKIEEAFIASYRSYGTRRLKVVLQQQGFVISRRYIAARMQELGLVSKYTKTQYKPANKGCNESAMTNQLNRHFAPGSARIIVVTDLTYVRVKERWHYLCVFVDLSNRQIIGSSAGKHKDARLVMKAISRIPINLSQLSLFHSDKGKEFDNRLIDECLSTFNIKRSLCPYDNAVAEATFKSIKTEFVKGEVFDSLADLAVKFERYVTWFNTKRIHSTLGYVPPVEFNKTVLQ